MNCLYCNKELKRLEEGVAELVCVSEDCLANGVVLAENLAQYSEYQVAAVDANSYKILAKYWEQMYTLAISGQMQ